MPKMRVIINPRTGEARIEGEGIETTGLKKSLEGLGKVIERHVGVAHVHAHEHEEVKSK